MIHAFHHGLAVATGVPAAVIHQEILRWCQYNQKDENEDLRHNGIYWMYTTHSRLHKHLPFYSISTIKRSMATLLDAGLILTRPRGLDNPKSLLYHALPHDTSLGQNDTTKTEPPGIKTTPLKGQNEPDGGVKMNSLNIGNNIGKQEKLAGAPAHEEQAEDGRTHSMKPMGVVIRFYDRLGKEPEARWLGKDEQRAASLMLAGFNPDQIVGVIDKRRDIQGMHYLSLDLMQELYPHLELDQGALDATRKQLASYDEVEPAEPEMAMAAIQDIKAQLTPNDQPEPEELTDREASERYGNGKDLPW